MSLRATKWPRQWCAPPPKPKCGLRSASMSKYGAVAAAVVTASSLALIL